MSERLLSFNRRHDYFVGVDSDGCVFSTMEIKQKSCFHPAIMDHWSLWPAEKEVRMVAEWVNLYSVHRGTNRFAALAMVFDCLRELPSFRAGLFSARQTDDIADYLSSGYPPGEDGLAAYLAVCPQLGDVYEWSRDVSRRVAARVVKIPPFCGVEKALSRAACKADIVVISATPEEALFREWRESGLEGAVDLVVGQESGSKFEQIEKTALGHYAPGRIMMVGDAPGDHEAAVRAGAVFFPVIPGREEESWLRLGTEGLDRFFSGDYRGCWEKALVEDFRSRLAAVPPWREPA